MSAISADGRWRWDGSRWVINEPGHVAGAPKPVLERTGDTLRAQQAVIGGLAVAIAVGLASAATWLPADYRYYPPHPPPPPFDEQAARAAALAFTTTFLAFGLVWEGLMIFAALRLWRWTYYVHIAGGAYAVYSATAYIREINGPRPVWLPAAFPVIDFATALLELFVALFLIALWLRYRRAWALRVARS